MCAQNQLLRLGDILQRFRPETLQLLTGGWYSARAHLERSGADPSETLPEEGRERALSIANTVHEECVKSGLRASTLSASRIVRAFQGDLPPQRQTVIDLYEELSRRVLDELSCEFFVQLSLSEADRYENWIKGWEIILQQQPEAMRDVEEMNKCFAFGRYTASMFHALHVAEHGAIALGNYIGVSDPKKGWGPTESKLRAIIKGGHGGLPESLAGQFAFLEQMNREIDSMVLAWRHKVDHAANHLAILPSTDFTPDIAEHIIGAVRIFMLRLTEHCPVTASTA